tara:strand:+ start:1696 stop:1911 length:216 start_codon:yes stop_codon:yes gene_type:complete
MTANESGIMYNGSYLCEGHEVSFIILTNDRVKVIEYNEAGGSSSSHEAYITIDEAIEKQDRLIKLGYDKVS